MRKGTRIRWLEVEARILGRRIDELHGMVQKLCPHASLQYRGEHVYDPNEWPIKPPPAYRFACEYCGKPFVLRVDEMPTGSRFRAILEACAVLEPEVPEPQTADAGQRIAEAMCAWANAQRVPTGKPFTVADFVPQPCLD